MTLLESFQSGVGNIVFGRGHADLLSDDTVQSVNVKYRIEVIIGEGNAFGSTAEVLFFLTY